MPGCDCTAIEASLIYWEASAAYDETALQLAQNDLETDQSEISYWQGLYYNCGCATAAQEGQEFEDPDVTLQRIAALKAKGDELRKELKDLGDKRDELNKKRTLGLDR